MLNGSNIDGSLWLNELNHNEKDNPHPQYNLPVFTSQIMQSGQWVNVFDKNFYDYIGFPDKTQGLNRLVFTAYLYNMLDNGYQELGILSTVIFCDSNVGGCYGKLSYLPLLDDIGDGHIARLYIKNLGNGMYNVKLYIKSKGNYKPIKIKPILYDPVLFINNTYAPYTCNVYNTYEMITDFMKDFPNNSPINESNLPVDYSSVIYDYNGRKSTYNRAPNEIIYSGGTTFDIQNTEVVRLACTTAQSLANITGGWFSCILTVYAANNNTTLINSGYSGAPNTLALKNNTNIQLSTGNNVTFRYSNNKWQEIGRNF